MLRLICIVLLMATTLSAGHGAPLVSGISAPADAPLYGRFQATFTVSTTASNLYWPYDISPNAGVPAGVGVSVDGLFTNDNWQTTRVQPAFYYQDYTANDQYHADQTWLYPNGSPLWVVRFAPTAAGQWKFRIRVTDSSGTTQSEEHAFTCAPSASHGFVRVSPNDSRYFELSDGTFVPMIGLNYDTPKVSDMETKYAQLETMGINLVRSWWQSSSVSLPFFGAGGQGGDLVWHNIRYSAEHLRPGHIVSAKLTSEHNGPVYKGLFTQVWVKPSTRYRVSAWIRTVGLTGSGASYGVYVAPGGERLHGDNDWREVTHEFVTEAGWYQASAAVCMENVTGGAAYVSDVSMREVLAGGQLGPELVSRPDLQAHTSYQQPTAYLIDRLLDTAERHGVYVRAVVQEKTDGFFACIQPDGTWGEFSVGNAYGSPTHASRTLQSYFWRYLIARWGYSTALHSFEYVNEGDPFDGTHISATKAFEDYVNAHDPNRHLVSTSNWHSFPPEMWRSVGGCADIHMYIGWGVASGGNRIWPGWDGSWWTPNAAVDANDLGPDFALDTTVAHTGRASLKITSPSSPGTPAGGEQQAKMSFQCGVVPGHEVRITAWAKAQNYVQYPPPNDWFGEGLMLYFDTNGPGWLGSPGDFKVPNGTYDWRLVTKQFTVPANAYCLGVLPRRFYTNSATPGYVWLDDIVVEDVTTGEVLNYNGGFEYVTPESYDVVAGHCAYSRLTRSFRCGKPIVRGEVGLTYPQRFTNPYKGISYSGEDQLLIDDAQGIWWKKWVWAQIDPGGLYEIYWMYHLPIARAYVHGGAFQRFMAGIPLSNGHYTDAAAASSNASVRALGQKDTANRRAHLWIDNVNHTWKNVVDGVSIASASGTVTLPGLPDGRYQVEWWDTTTGAATRVEEIDCTNGSLSLQITNLSTDVACRITPVLRGGTVRLIDVPASVVPGEVVTLTVQYAGGDAEERDVNMRVLVPPQTTYISGSAEATGGSYDTSSNTVGWLIDVVAAGQVFARTFQARIK